MFYNCYALTSLDLSSFNTSNVNTMQSVFQGCKALTSLDLSNFDTGKVNFFSDMFNGCTALTTLNLSSFTATQSPTASGMFTSCTKLTTLICTRAFLTKIISKSCGLTIINSTGSNISDTAAHTWTIANLKVTAVA